MVVSVGPIFSFDLREFDWKEVRTLKNISGFYIVDVENIIWLDFYGGVVGVFDTIVCPFLIKKIFMPGV